MYMVLITVWIVLFIFWAIGGWLVYSSDARASYRAPHNGILAILLGILGWMVFFGPHVPK